MGWLEKIKNGASGRQGKAPQRKAPQNHQYITLRELKRATNNFSEVREIGYGGFGKVYKGFLDDGTMCAVKRRSTDSSQGKKEFHMEIELLSMLEHHNLVKLIGYCDEKNEMILVYDYMENGSLKSHLYGLDKPSLSWNQRLEILVGAAKALDYLHREHYVHTGSEKAIIHRDVKSANILLDGNLCAKVCDFGISKTGPSQDQTHVSTKVKGTPGYLAPEYARSELLNEKSDVYSFGVVLLEVLCARQVTDSTLPEGEAWLPEWGMEMIKKGELRKIVDQRISTIIKQRPLELFGKIVEKCQAAERDRPSMQVVLKDLEDIQRLEDNNFLRRTEGKKFSRASVPADPHGPSTSQVQSSVLDEGISATTVSGKSDESGDSVSSQPATNPVPRKEFKRSLGFKFPDDQEHLH